MPSPDALARVLEAQRIRRTVTARLRDQRRRDAESTGLLIAIGLLLFAAATFALTPMVLG